MTVLLLSLGLLPSFVWLIFFLKEDFHPEPPKLILFVFLAGIGSAFIGAFAQKFLADYFSMVPNGPLPPLTILTFAFIEEVVKFGAAFLVVHKSASFDEPVDAVIYMIVAAMGFAALENVGSLLQATRSGATTVNQLELISLRFVGPTLLHSLASGIVGYYWAMAIREFNRYRLILLGIVFGTALHAIFNGLILQYDNKSLLVPILFVSFVGFIIVADVEKLRRKTI